MRWHCFLHRALRPSSRDPSWMYCMRTIQYSLAAGQSLCRSTRRLEPSMFYRCIGAKRKQSLSVVAGACANLMAPKSTIAISSRGFVSRDGRADSEISRKIGRAYADLKLFGSVWSHAGASLQEKLQKLASLVLSCWHMDYARSCLSRPKDEG